MNRTITIDYKPTQKQTMFHKSAADEVLYGGAAGGGKSKACVMEALYLCMTHPNTHAYLFRRSYPELRDTLIAEASRSIPTELGKYNGTNYDYKLINGSVMHFRYCNGMSDVTRYQGVEIHWLFIDELTHFEKDVYDYLKTRLRAPTRLHIKPLVRCTSNPGGIGHAWVKAMFIDGKEPYKIYENIVKSTVLGIEQTKTVQYIPALATDNPHISSDYILELEQKPERLRKALLLGQWDAFEGQYFSEFVDDPQHYADGKYTHVIDPFEIPPDWNIYRSFDWGHSKPFSVGWWAVDPDGVIYRILEYYGCTRTPNEGVKLTPYQVFEEVHKFETTHKWLKGKHITGVADPAIFNSETGESIADVASKFFVYFNPGDHTRIPGWLQMRYRMSFNEFGKPMMYIFSNCKAFIRTIPTLIYDIRKVEDLDTAGEDHVADETRYMCMTRPIAPKLLKQKDDYENSPMYMYLNIPKDDIKPYQEMPKTVIIQ